MKRQPRTEREQLRAARRRIRELSKGLKKTKAENNELFRENCRMLREWGSESIKLGCMSDSIQLTGEHAEKCFSAFAFLGEATKAAAHMTAAKPIHLTWALLQLASAEATRAEFDRVQFLRAAGWRFDEVRPIVEESMQAPQINHFQPEASA